MHLIRSLAVCSLLAAAAHAEDAVKPSARIDLFNGKDMAGWVLQVKDPAVKPEQVWSVRDGAIRCEGQPFGYMRTDKAYADYRLHAEWRWPEKPSNSGVLMHITGADTVFPTCVEAQLKSENAGDLYCFGDVDFAERGPEKSKLVRKQKPCNEKPIGQWNSYDIVARGDTIELTVNGELQNRATRTRPAAGYIGFQSEGAPVEFRNLYLLPAGEK